MMCSRAWTALRHTLWVSIGFDCLVVASVDILSQPGSLGTDDEPLFGSLDIDDEPLFGSPGMDDEPLLGSLGMHDEHLSTGLDIDNEQLRMEDRLPPVPAFEELHEADCRLRPWEPGCDGKAYAHGEAPTSLLGTRSSQPQVVPLLLSNNSMGAGSSSHVSNDCCATTSGGSCTPQCSWKCDSPKCDEICAPKCKPPVCETRCPSTPDLSQCSFQCDKPQCSVQCPERACPSFGCPVCSTTCSEPHCKLTCAGDQYCTTVCEQPDCEWECRAPTDCPAPKCQMMCEQPTTCMGSTYQQMPALQAGELSVQSFQAGNVNLLQVESETRRTSHMRVEAKVMPPSTYGLHVDVRSLAKYLDVAPKRLIISVPVNLSSLPSNISEVSRSR